MEKKHIVWLDFARCIAILSVVACHSIETEYYFVRFGKIDVSLASWIFQNIIFTIGRIGVPLFLMITGSLMIGREYDIKKYYLRTFFPLLVTTEIWIIINYILIFYNGAFDKIDLLKEMLFLKMPEMNHMWYMPMIIGMYLVIPFVSKAIKNFEIKEVILPLGIAILAFFCLPLYNAFSGEVIQGISDLSITMDISFLGGTYAVYMILGYYIGEKHLLENIKIGILVLVGIGAFTLNSLGAFYFLSNKLFHTDIFGYYQSPFLLIIGIIAFECIRRYLNKDNRLVRFISKISFGIYLLHNIFLQICMNFFMNIGFYEKENIVEKFLMNFVVSLFFSIMLCKILDVLPFFRIKKILLYIKN